MKSSTVSSPSSLNSLMKKWLKKWLKNWLKNSRSILPRTRLPKSWRSSASGNSPRPAHAVGLIISSKLTDALVIGCGLSVVDCYYRNPDNENRETEQRRSRRGKAQNHQGFYLFSCPSFLRGEISSSLESYNIPTTDNQ